MYVSGIERQNIILGEKNVLFSSLEVWKNCDTSNEQGLGVNISGILPTLGPIGASVEKNRNVRGFGYSYIMRWCFFLNIPGR